jgi:hypothetical protein
VAPDGEHFVMIQNNGTTQQPVVALSWVQDVIEQVRRQSEE